MDDMKNLVERYKRELMEYSRKAPQPAAPAAVQRPAYNPPPEIISQPAQEAAPLPSASDTEETAQPETRDYQDTPTQEQNATETYQSEYTQPTKSQKAPEIIGYSDSMDLMSRFSDMFAELSVSETSEPSEQPEPQDNPTLSEQEVQEVFPTIPEDDDYTDSYIGEQPRILPAEDDYNGVSTVTPDEAEDIGDIPESGTNENEQLGRRDFETQDETVNSREDIQPLQQVGTAPIPDIPVYDNLQDFTDANPRRGTVRFQTYTARGALPVKDAKIVVSKPIGGQTHIFYTLTTDISGMSPIASLPAPPKELSETPDSQITPYATYNALVTAKGFNDVQLQNIPVFEGVLSMQRVALVPSVGNKQTEIVDETEPALNGGV